MKKLALFATLCSLPFVLVSCEMPAVEQDVVTTPTGAKMKLVENLQNPTYKSIEWDGATDSNGMASGKGTATYHLSAGGKTVTQGTYAGGKLSNGFASKTTYDKDGARVSGESGEVMGGYWSSREYWNYAPTKSSDTVYQKMYYSNGRLHGKSIFRYQSGHYDLDMWNNGSHVREEKFDPAGNLISSSNPAAAAASSDDGFEDLLIGGMLAVGGASAGDANVANAGVSYMSGDYGGAISQLSNSGGGTTSGAMASGGGGGGGGGLQQAGGNVANKPNLIDQYGLGRYRGSGDDHIVHYIRAADQAFQSYKASGTSAYYDQHKEYADLAKAFHERT